MHQVNRRGYYIGITFKYHAPPEYRSLIWPVLKFRYRSILKLFRAELTAYGVRGNTNGPILAAIMAALSFHPAAAMAVAGMRVCPA